MSILILSQVPHEVAPFEKWLRHRDEELVLIAAEGVVDSFPVDAYAHIETYSETLLEENVLLRMVELNKEYQFSSLVTLFEFGLLPLAKLRERWGLPGQKTASAIMYRDKMAMKERARQCGLAVPEDFALLNDALDLYDFVQRNSFPIVVKPVDGAGSIETHFLHSLSDMVDFVKQGFVPGRFEAETFVEGELYHIDALVQQGEMVFCSVGRYLEGNCLGPSGGSVVASYLIADDSPLAKRMKEYTKKLVRAFDTPDNTTIHCELFHTVDDEIVLCEVASRSGGGKIVNCIKQTYGIDLYHALTLCHVGDPVPLPESFGPQLLHGFLLIPPQEGRMLAIPEEQPPTWVKEYFIKAKPGQVFQKHTFSTDSIAGVVVEGETEEMVRQRLMEIGEWLLQRFVWET